MSSTTDVHPTVMPLSRRVTRPAGVSPGHENLRPRGQTGGDAGRRLEDLVAVEARRAAQARRRAR